MSSFANIPAHVTSNMLINFMPLFVLILAQLLFSISDFTARDGMIKYGFTIAAFKESWFLVYLLFHLTAMCGQLYIFSQYSLGKTSVLFAAVSMIIANILGLLFLKEAITWPVIVAGVLVIAALFVLQYR